jgi:hypothetical protein
MSNIVLLDAGPLGLVSQGHPTAHDAAPDADVILAGQAATVGKRKVIVASTNPRHLQRFVTAEHWQDIVV